MFLSVCAPAVAQQKGGKTARVDTFKLADKLIAKKKYRKAARLYEAYRKNHPKDMNVSWKLAQVNLWMSNHRKSDAAYKEALKLAPKNDYLNLNYIHSLLDMGKLGEAGARLTDMELAGKDYPNMAYLRAKLNYYQGDYKRAAAYIRKDLNAESDNAESKELRDMIEMARSPLVSLNTSYLSDNQPLAALISTIKAEAFFHKYATLYLIADEYHFTKNRVADAPWFRVGDKLYFPEAGMHMNVGVGIVKFPVKNTVGWSGNFAINKRISSQFDGDLSLDHVPYMDTKTSIDTNVSATRFAAMLNWHLRGWSAQAAFLNSNFTGSNNVYGAYAWGLAPLVHQSKVQLLAGYSVSYSNSTENSYRPVLSVNEIIANYTPTYSISGVFDPYFSPNTLLINSFLMALNLQPSKKVSINLSGDVGYGSIKNPYLYLNQNLDIEKGYSNESFTPVSASAAFNYHIDKTWLLSAKYAYRNTYFFTSHYVSLGIQKSFQHGKKKQGSGRSGSTFSGQVKEIENDIQALYSCKSASELKSSVGRIRSQLVKLRDAEKRRMSMTEVTPHSEEAMAMQEHYDSLNDMINELDDVNLDDYKETGRSKKNWLIDKIYELTSVSYDGNL